MASPNAGSGASENGLSESELIERFFKRTKSADGLLLGIGDDAALLNIPAGEELAVSVDTIVAGRHFPEDTEPRAIGHRALAVNLSDMAAMGATPKWITLSLTLPEANEAWLSEFAAGLWDLADQFGVQLIGGDTTGGALTIGVQILGLVSSGMALRRDGGKPGDLVVVSGTLGDAAAGLKYVQSGANIEEGSAAMKLVHRFEYPTPRVELGLAARTLASGAMDISDGLAADVPKFARASGVRACIEVGKVPISRELRALCSSEHALDLALGGGDDYELLFSVPPKNFEALGDAARRLNLTLTIIGELREGVGVQWTMNGDDFAPRVKGFDHFDRPSTQITV